MKKSVIFPLFLFFLVISGCSGPVEKISKFDFSGPRDPSLIRGFNYTPANVASPRHHVDCWISYDSATIEFDLDLAKSLNLNQVRVFVPYTVYIEDSVALPAKLKHFVRECHERNIGVMPVLQAGPWVRDTTQRALGKNWVRFLVNAISDEPGLVMWDVQNEPDYPPTPRERVLRNFEKCKIMSKTFHELDPETPVTIGMAFVGGMIDMADYVDVLQFHDYMQTRGQIRDTIARAKEFAAIMGFFRKRTADILPAVPDNEGWVTRIVDRSDKWLKDAEGTWKDGLDIAETAAHLLESAELTAMRIPPTQEVEMLRQGEVNLNALKELVLRFKVQLEPHRKPPVQK